MKSRIVDLGPIKTIRSFTVALNSSMGLKSGRGQGSFIDGLLAAIDTFYGEVLQSLKAWAAKPPRMREQTDTSELAKDQEVPPALVATALSCQDGPTLEEAVSPSAGSAQLATARVRSFTSRRRRFDLLSGAATPNCDVDYKA